MRTGLILVLFLLFEIAVEPYAIGAEVSRLVSLHMVSRQSGWAMSGKASSYHVLKTHDGGWHWKDVSPKGFSNIAQNDWNHDIFQQSVGRDFQDKQNAWLAIVSAQSLYGPMYVYHTTNGGRKWTLTRFATKRVGNRTYIQFLDCQHGFILSVSDPAAGEMAKRVYGTTDGGRTWQWRSEVNGDKYGRWMFYPSGMTFRSPNEGWITGSNHGEPPIPFLHTRNGGRTWRVEELTVPALPGNGYGNTQPPVFFGKRRRQGMFTLTGKALFLTSDGGATWGCRQIPQAVSNTSLWFANNRNGWGLSSDASRFYGTHDGGRTWHQLTTHLRRLQVPGIINYDNSELDFISAQIGWALIVGQRDVSLIPYGSNPPSESELRQTQDGGRHWRTIKLIVGAAP